MCRRARSRRSWLARRSGSRAAGSCLDGRRHQIGPAAFRERLELAAAFDSRIILELALEEQPCGKRGVPANDFTAPFAVETAGLGDIAGDVTQLGLEASRRQIPLHRLAAAELHRVRIKQDSVRLEDSSGLAEEAPAIGIVV